jgi:signal transduction histidine kinase
MGVMVNSWTPVLLAWIAICVIVVGVMPTPRGRGLDAVGLGALLVPLTGLYLWAFGITSSFDSWAQVAAASPGQGPTWQTVSTPGYLFGTTTIKQAFLIGMVIVGVAAAITVRAPRQAAYLAAVSLVVFGLVEAVTAIACNPQINDYHWWDWLLWAWSSWRAGVWVVAFASVTAGFWLSRRTIVADLRAGRALTARVERLTETRAEVVDAAAAELRRLERDLHDGAQARLVALGINLRAAERMIRTQPDAAVALVAECRETSAQALSDLRNLVRGIYPPVLADRGLGDAVQALALDCPVPVVTDISLPGRPPGPVESAVYFAVAEALNNVAKHSNATCALVRLVYGGGMLRAEITDDGSGGADTRNGTGLAGIESRLGAFDGILAVNSPVGGPTIVVIEVPCVLSSPKISTC